MIHQYKLNGYNIVLDVNSGSVHLVDELAYDIIEMYENSDKSAIISAMLDKYGDNPEITEQEICECIDDVEELKQNGRLFTEDKYENLAFRAHLQPQLRILLCKSGQIPRRTRFDEP